MSDVPTRVVKVGGSLLQWDSLRKGLTDWFASQAPAVDVVIVGGGRWVDAVRDCDQRYQLGDSVSHTMSLKAMTLTAYLVSKLLENADFVQSPQRLRELIRRKCIDRKLVFASESLFASNGCRNDPQLWIPENWSATSDSIAARVAEWLNANELVLLKSVCPSSGRVTTAASSGYVDEFFPTASRDLATIRFVNLRQPKSAEYTAT